MAAIDIIFLCVDLSEILKVINQKYIFAALSYQNDYIIIIFHQYHKNRTPTYLEKGDSFLLVLDLGSDVILHLDQPSRFLCSRRNLGQSISLVENGGILIHQPIVIMSRLEMARRDGE